MTATEPATDAGGDAVTQTLPFEEYDPAVTSERPTGTCRECGQVVTTFLYAVRAPAPWWYVVTHDVEGERCPGSGHAAVEQVKPAKAPEAQP